MTSGDLDAAVALLRSADDNSSHDDWTGGDSTYSIQLPDGRTLWIFSDTFLGTVNPDGSRPVVEEGGATVMLNNSFVIQDGDRLTTIIGGEPGAPASLLEARDRGFTGGSVFWAGDAIMHDGHIEIAYRRHSPYGFAQGLAVTRFDPADLTRPVEVRELETTSFVSWGSAVVRADGYTYVYGVEDTSEAKHLRVARVEGDSLFGTWEFYTGDGQWSGSEQAAANQFVGVANEFSVTRMGDAYVLVTHDTTEPLSPDIVAYAAASPLGPFEDKTVLYRTPETGAAGTYRNPNVYTSNAHAHPGVDRGSDGLLISYNVNAFAPPDWAPGEPLEVYSDASIYRPRFVTVRFAS